IRRIDQLRPATYLTHTASVHRGPGQPSQDVSAAPHLPTRLVRMQRRALLSTSSTRLHWLPRAGSSVGRAGDFQSQGRTVFGGATPAARSVLRARVEHAAVLREGKSSAM